jgi:ABC-2 type transport system ATP-binding protein
LIEVTDLSKAYGPVQALKGVSFHVNAGEVVGLLGPNGAGKTTLMKVLTGYLHSDTGRVLIDGLDVAGETLAVQRRIGCLLENAPLYPEMSVQGYLRMIADLRQIPKSDRPLLLSKAIRATSLEDQLTRPIGQLSKGFRQRVGLAQAILHDPPVLILDEPTVGLDPTQILEVRRLILRLAEHTTVLLSTHILSEVEAICDRAIVLINGELRADARLSELAAAAVVVLVLQAEALDVTSELEALDGVSTVESGRTDDGTEYRVVSADQTDMREAVYSLAREGDWPLRELRRDQGTLEAVFGELVSAADDGDFPNQANDK